MTNKIKNKFIQTIVLVVMLLVFPDYSFGQAPTLGTAANFVFFSTNGAIKNSGISQVTGNVGTNNGAISGFGNVNGNMDNADSASSKCAKDLLTAYNFLKSATSTFNISSNMGNGDTLVAGVYAVSGATTVGGNLYLDAKGKSSAVFIFQVSGAFATKALTKVKLINGAMACNVFWKIEGAVGFAAGTTMRGTIIANNSAISFNAGDTLEGRAMTTAGAVSIDGVMAYTPIGCGTPTLTGPVAPSLGTTVCFGLFSGNGSVSNSGTSQITGDIGTNVGKSTGFDSTLVIGKIYTKPDLITAQAAADLKKLADKLDSLTYDIELLYPAQFGKNLVLTPHTYLLNAATTLTDSVYLNAEGNKDAVFVMKINGAFSTSTYSNIILENGAQSKNVFWLVKGAAGINDYSIFRGTLVCVNGAIDAINTGVIVDGRAMTTTGALKTAAVSVIMSPGCGSATTTGIEIKTQPVNQTQCPGNTAKFTVIASGTGLSYQWRNGTVNLSNGGSYSGVKTASLTINPVSTSNASTNYNVIISATIGANDTSKNASLIVNALPVITKAPSSLILCDGNTANFSVTATGSWLTYQWRNGNYIIKDSANVSGSATSKLIIANPTSKDVSSDYYVIISGVCSSSDTTKTVSLTLNQSVVITSEPVSQTICEGGSVSFSVSGTGTGLTYQWRNGTTNILNSSSITGANSAILSMYPVYLSKASSNINVIVSGNCPKIDSSVKVSLIVNSYPLILAGPTNQAGKEGGSVSFDVVASGTGLSYQWKRGAGNLADGGNISGSNTATITFNPLAFSDSAANYSIVITGTCPQAAISDDVYLRVSSLTGISTINLNQNNEQVLIFPNPFNSALNIVLNNNSALSNYEFRLFNINGTEIKNQFITVPSATVQTGELPAGIYFYKIIAQNKIVQTGKIVSVK